MIHQGMSVIALKKFGFDYPLVLIKNKDKTGFCGFNINLNMDFDKEKSYEVFRDELQIKFKEIITFVKENSNLREYFTEKGCINVPEGTEVPVELIRIEGISFTKDTGDGALKEAYPDLYDFIQENFKVKKISYNPCGMTIFYRVEFEDGFKINF